MMDDASTHSMALDSEDERGMATPASSTCASAPMTEGEQRERRASIREIMTDPSLAPLERRRSIQGLMDGRRLSSGGASIPNAVGMSMMAAATAAAADFYSSSDDDLSDDDHDMDHDGGEYYMHDHHSGHTGGSDNDDNISVASSISSRAGSSRAGSSRASSSRASGRKKIMSRSASLRSFASAAEAGAAAAAAAAMYSIDDGSGKNLTAVSKRMEKSRPECTHYERNCTIISPCCGLAFACRICHDECPVLPSPINNNKASSSSGGAVLLPAKDPPQQKLSSQDLQSNASGQQKGTSLKRSTSTTSLNEEETHHNIDRFAIKEVICRKCFTRQSSKTNNCITCNVPFGEYHCNVCNLWMSAAEEPYHCKDCGFCRVGGHENFRHCHDCGMCIDALVFNDHNCKTGKYMSNCPVCQEDLFSSRSASHEMPCGHAIHWDCFRELTAFDTRCPVCKKTAETHEQMAPTWSAMAMGIALQPVPPELARVVTIICNDCEERDEHRRWHFLGTQCNKCASFNTTVENTELMGQEAHAYLEQNTQSEENAGEALRLIMEQSTMVDNNNIDSGRNNGESSQNAVRNDRILNRTQSSPADLVGQLGGGAAMDST